MCVCGKTLNAGVIHNKIHIGTVFDKYIYIYKHILNTIKNLKIRMYIILIVKSFITVAILAQERLAVSDLCGDITQT